MSYFPMSYFYAWILHLYGPFEVWLGEAQPQHAGDGHAHAEPGEEAEEVDDGEDVLRDGVHHGQQALDEQEKERAPSVLPT